MDFCGVAYPHSEQLWHHLICGLKQFNIEQSGCIHNNSQHRFFFSYYPSPPRKIQPGYILSNYDECNIEFVIVWFRVHKVQIHKFKCSEMWRTWNMNLPCFITSPGWEVITSCLLSSVVMTLRKPQRASTSSISCRCARITFKDNTTNVLYFVLYTYNNTIYSGTSDKGHSVLRTQYKKPPYKGHVFVTQTTIFLYFLCTITLWKVGHLSINDNMDNICWSQGVLCMGVPLYTHSSQRWVYSACYHLCMRYLYNYIIAWLRVQLGW